MRFCFLETQHACCGPHSQSPSRSGTAATGQSAKTRPLYPRHQLRLRHQQHPKHPLRLKRHHHLPPRNNQNTRTRTMMTMTMTMTDRIHPKPKGAIVVTEGTAAMTVVMIAPTPQTMTTTVLPAAAHVEAQLAPDVRRPGRLI